MDNIQSYTEVEWPVTPVFIANQNTKETTVVNIGGARSSKSYSILQLFIGKFMSERNKSFCTTRKTLPALRQTAYKMAIDMLKEKKIYGRVEHNKSENTLKLNWLNNWWLFTSIDNPEKIKSSEFNYIHMEEANEFTYDDYRILKLRLSGQTKEGEKNQVFLSLNPSDDRGWIKEELMQKEKCDIIHSTYLDNLKFLPAEYIKELEMLREQDDTYWKIYGLGEWAAIKEIIYRPLEMVDAFPVVEDEIYGLDFGYNNPSTLIKIGLKELSACLTELIYERYLTNTQLIDRLRVAIPEGDRKSKPIYADSAEPARIKEIEDAGFLIYPANKNVKDGIDFLKKYKLYSLLENVNVNREFPRYKYRKDRNNIVLDEPVKFDDHTPDAVRYGIYTHCMKGEDFAGFYGEDWR